MNRTENTVRVLLAMAALMAQHDRLRHAGVGQLCLQVDAAGWKATR